MDRCFLAGLAGDAINAVLAAAGSNLRKLLRRLAAALISWLHVFAAQLPAFRIAAGFDRIMLQPPPDAPRSRLRLRLCA